MQFLGLLSFAIAMGVVEGVYVAQIGIAPDINSLDKILGKVGIGVAILLIALLQVVVHC